LVAKSTKSDPLALAPEYFYCRDSEKYSNVIFNRASRDSEEERCGKAVSNAKEAWAVFRREADTANFKRLFDTCCAPALTPPKGKIYKLRKKIIKRKVVEAKTSVSIDFTKDENKDKREKFERVYIKRAKAKTTSKFAYKKKGAPSRRRLSEGTEVTVTLEYDNDTAAEEGKSVVAATNFTSGLKEDLKEEGVDTTVTETSASITTVQEEVVEQYLEDETTTATTTQAGETTKAGEATTEVGETTKPGEATTEVGETTKAGETTAKVGQAQGNTTVNAGQSTSQTTTTASNDQTTVEDEQTTVRTVTTTFVLSTGTTVLSNSMFSLATTLIAIVTLL